MLASIDHGAKLLLGGEIPFRNGRLLPSDGSCRSETGHAGLATMNFFGPVAAIIKAKGELDAVRIANDTIYGLGAAVFTRDIQRGEQVARATLEAGSTFVNSLVASDPRLPFGGIKQSGYGRELGSYGIKEFVNAKTIYVKG